MQNLPLVSIVMPAYNTEAYIAEAIESILNQTFQEFEFIIINDGSTDKTLEIIQSYQAKDKRIKIISQENRGISISLNKGIGIATGKYIARMDSDDIALELKLAKQVHYMENHPEIGVLGCLVKVFGNGVEHTWKYPLSDEEARSWLIFGVPFLHPTVIIRKELLVRNNLNYDSSFNLSEDYHLWIRLSDITKITNLPEILLLVRNNKTSSTKLNGDLAAKKSEQVNLIQLKKIFIYPTIQELKIHSCLRYDVYLSSFDFLSNVNNWLINIYHQNMIVKFFPEPELSVILADKWFNTCYHCTELGLITLKLYLKSPLRKFVSVNFQTRIKFFSKCLFRRKVGARETFLIRFVKKITKLS